VWVLVLFAILALWQGRGLNASSAFTGKEGTIWQASEEPSPTVSATPDEEATTTPTPTPTPTATSTAAIPTATSTPTVTPSSTATPTEWFDPALAHQIWCGGVYQGNTTGKPNRVSQYSACGCLWDESGPEDVYIIPKAVSGDLEVFVEPLDSLADMDLFLLTSPYASSCIGLTESRIVWEDLAPGTYYLIVDGFHGSAGAYRLTLNCADEPTPTATATYTPQFFRLPMVFKPRPATPTPTPTLTPTAPPYSLGVNCGGGDYAASDGMTYLADRAYTAGGWGWTGGQANFVTTTTKDIVATTDDPLYQSQRYGMDAYHFDVSRGRYKVYLRFAEIFPYISVGQRVFNVQLEGISVITNLDLLAKGARLHPYDQEFYVDVTDSRLDITFTQDAGYSFGPVLNAVSVVYVGSPSAPAPPAP
jgi:hypothetical protein